MEYRRHSHGLLTFLEHYWLLIICLIVLLTSQAPIFFAQLSPGSWLAFCMGSIALQIAGACLIGYSKLPAYRSGKFFTFGVKTAPATLAACYQRGWRLFLLGVVLSLVLLGSKL